MLELITTITLSVLIGYWLYLGVLWTQRTATIFSRNIKIMKYKLNLWSLNKMV